MNERISASNAIQAGEASSAFRAEQGRRDRRFRAALGFGLGLALIGGVMGCHKTQQATSENSVDQNAGDPADANLAPVSGSAPAQVLGQNAQYTSQQQGEDYSQQPPAPIEQAYPQNQPLTDEQAADAYNADLTDAEASEPPPPLPDYEQPPDPDPNYIWTPGYWAWGPGGYYWVPGAWVAPPYVGALWTPGYWGFIGGVYRFHHGFWGLHIGYYGGIDYGFGYTGYGYYGGYWNGNRFFYNTAVNRVNTNVVRDVYTHNVVMNNRVVNSRIVNPVSYNGGRGGVQAAPRPAEMAVLHEQRNAPMATQVQAQREAAQNRQQFYSANKGRPPVSAAATPVLADRTPPAALPRIAVPAARGEVRPGQTPATEARPQSQPSPMVRNAPEARPAPETRPAQAPQNRPEPQVRPAQPQPEARPAPQPRPESQARPAPQARPESQARPAPQPRPEVQPRPETQPRPQEQARPQPAPRSEAAPHPQPEAHPAPPPRPQPQHSEPHPDEKPHR